METHEATHNERRVQVAVMNSIAHAERGRRLELCLAVRTYSIEDIGWGLRESSSMVTGSGAASRPRLFTSNVQTSD
jgi:hypothetical protein